MKLSLLVFVLMLNISVFSQEDWANLKRYQSENSNLNLEDLKEIKVVFMGNSIVEGWVNLQPDFFKKNNYVGRGISGQTTPQMLLRFRQDVINLKPKVVVILAGTNDIAGNTGFSTLEMIFDNIMSMCDLAIKNNMKVVLCSVLPAKDYYWKPGVEPAEKIVKLNTMIYQFAKQNHIEYCDFHTFMKDEENSLKKEYGEDGVHPNMDGYNLMNKLVQKSINKASR